MNYREIYVTRSADHATTTTNDITRSTYHVATSTNDVNRYSLISQHSIQSALSVGSQHGDSGIDCDQEGTQPAGATSSSEASTPDEMKDMSFTSTSNDGVLVPFLVLMVKDVYFLNHSIPTVQKDGKINVEVG